MLDFLDVLLDAVGRGCGLLLLQAGQGGFVLLIVEIDSDTAAREQRDADERHGVDRVLAKQLTAGRETEELWALHLGTAPLTNDFIGAQQQLRRNREAERSGGLEVDHELELGRLFHGKVAGFGALENLVNIDGGTAVHDRHVNPVGHEAAGLGELLVEVNSWKAVPPRQIGDFLNLHGEQAVRYDIHRVGLNRDNLVERPGEFLDTTDLDNQKLESQCLRRTCGVTQDEATHVRRLVGTKDHRGHPLDAWRNGLEQLQALGVQLRTEVADAGDIAARSRKARHQPRRHGISADNHYDRDVFGHTPHRFGVVVSDGH